MRAYCVKCRDTKEIPDENTTRIMNKWDIPMLQGKCLDCGKVCNTFLKREGGAHTPRVRVKKPKKESAFGAALGKKLKASKKKVSDLPEEGVTPPLEEDSPPPPVPPPPSVPEE